MYTAAQRGEATVTVLRRTVPAAVPSVHFLSGGQTPEEVRAGLQREGESTLCVTIWRPILFPALKCAVSRRGA